MLGGKREMRIVFKQKGFNAIKRDSDGFKRLPGGDYSEVDFRGEGRYIFGEGSIVGDFQDLGNRTKIGNGTTIGDGTKIGDETTIGSWTKIGDGTKIGSWAKIGNGATIGSWTKIGNGTKIGDETTIGSWTMIGDGAMIGDKTTIGSWTMIGDGAKIGDGTTIGSWTKIGNGATIGDGNTIGKWATIGEFFTYGKNTTFEGGAVRNGRYVKVGQIGSENREAYFFIDENGKFFVRAGCWFSDMEKFIERVKGVHGGTQFENQYLAACEYARAVLPGMLEEAKK